MTKTASTTNEQRPPRVDSVELERRLQVAESALAQMHAVGELAVRSKADFIANISHELRTPLQSIIGFSELGASMAERHTGSSGSSGHSGHSGHSGDVAHAEYREMFNDICAGGHRMLSLVNALLDVASLGSSIGSLILQRIDLIELIESVVSVLRSQTSPDALQLSFTHDGGPVWALADAARMQQVLTNVLSNARKFGASTGTTRIEIHCDSRSAEGIEINVRDHGPGIPVDELDLIFEPFVQSSRTRDGAGGVGLGLTVCRKTMGAHGGSIRAANAPGGGSVFRIILPPFNVQPNPAL